MPSQEFSYLLDGSTKLVVYFSTKTGEVGRFVVKLEYEEGGVWKEIMRYDCFHGYVHKDVLTRAGEKKRVVRYSYLDPGTGLNAAIADCADNFPSYIERWRDG